MKTKTDHQQQRKQSAQILIRAFCLLVTLTCLTGCLGIKNEPIVENNTVIHDPFETSNRIVFAFNQKFDNHILYPLLKGYRRIVPEPARKCVHNFLQNLGTPATMLNELLQGDLDGTGTAFIRMAINTTVGIGGLIDVAGHEGIEYESEDFGQTLAVWGVDHGPYVVVPFIGASSLRDYSGYFADSMMDPMRWYLYNTNHDDLYYAKFGVGYLDLRNGLMDVLKELEASSFDYYAAVRSTYYQTRSTMVRDRSSDYNAPSIPDYDDEEYTDE